jgi:hypothetical protein
MVLPFFIQPAPLSHCYKLLAMNIGCRGLQRDVVYLGWPIGPSYLSPNAGGGGGEFRGLSQWVQLYTGDLTPYLTYDWMGLHGSAHPCNAYCQSDMTTPLSWCSETVGYQWRMGEAFGAHPLRGRKWNRFPLLILTGFVQLLLTQTQVR